MELTYDNMMAHMKKLYDMLPSVTPETKHKLVDCMSPDFVCTSGMGKTREEWAEHVSSHYEKYRAHVSYEPYPHYILIDEKKRIAACVTKEVAKHPVTGEPVKQWKDPYTGGLLDTIYLMEHYEFTLVGDEVKIKNALMARVPPGTF